MSDVKVQVVMKAIQYMKEHLDEEITSDSLAKYVGYSPYHFSRVFKEVTGVPPRHYLSALRIESGKQLLVNSSNSILKTLLGVGFRSFGTYSSKFKQFVGLSPKQFQKNMHSLHQFIHEYNFPNEGFPLEDIGPSITCHIIAPPSFKGIIFVGLFPKPIPDQAPIVGTALTHNQTRCTFSKVPLGDYYVLAAGIPKSLNPKNYFILDSALRGKTDSRIEIISANHKDVKIQLRDPLPYDPPILVNLPKLLFDKIRKQEEIS
ncbi:helix-turn-helix transcriptional regulator [Ornithinibacillus scapharcae]|uniref:helix-turn-helix transcriptional regulator n=1 Tax=Ornithinibacillus scapharcae TaxID=1147159 RepID=UPI000225C004|nr:AraC family transcriptional regulator [Ornithinibacillus scapharcae]